MNPLTGSAPPAPRPHVSAVSAATLARPDPVAAARALLAALGADGDALAAVVRAVAGIAGAPAAVAYRREGERLLLAHRHGDEILADEAVAGSLTGEDLLDGAGAVGLPLELTALPQDGPSVRSLHGRPFAILSLAAGALALGPLRSAGLRRRERAALEQLAPLVDGALTEALRAAAREAELAALRSEVEMGHRALGSTIDEERAFGLLLDLAITSSGARAGLVAVRDGARMRLAAQRDLPDGFDRLDLTPGAGVIAEVPGIPGLLVVEGFGALMSLGLDGLLAVGGPAGGSEIELMFALVPDGDDALPDDCAGLLETIVAQAALVLESSRAARETSGRHLAALRGLCRALDLRSPATASHHELVARTAEAIARRLGLPDAERHEIVSAALVHDVGMLAADSTIAAEFAHPSLGAEMAALVPGAGTLAPLLRAHHEWFDGFGFPAGLAGEAIPRGGRVLAAAEFYVETLQFWGSEKDASGIEEEISARRGTQLDPKCADAMLSMFREGG